MPRENPSRGYWTTSRGELVKINLEGCRICGRVYVSAGNSNILRVHSGWYPLNELQQKAPGEDGLDKVIRVRGRVWGKKLGERICPDCK